MTISIPIPPLMFWFGFFVATYICGYIATWIVFSDFGQSHYFRATISAFAWPIFIVVMIGAIFADFMREVL